MKLKNTLLYAAGLFVFSAPVMAQQNEGIIAFEEKVNMHRSIPEEDAQIRSMIPEWRINMSELLFNADESLYRNVEEEEEEEMGDGQGMVIRMQRPEATFYRNFSTMRKADARDFAGKKYLIEDALKGGNWKVTTETKQVLGYNCMKATTTDTIRKREISAWFTPDLPLPAGPLNFGELPGTILEVDINNGEIVVAAKKVEFKKLKKGELKAPTKGEKINEADFQQLMAEQMRQNGGKPIRIIRN
ncbi:MAG: GLPGLI family protein [Saprospiraceae bacterium]|nr:GLPGLI family protein [Saprospiraceae bacterium]